MPGMESLTNGDISRKREMLKEMISGCWMACHAPCPKTGQSFAADAIISNPPAFAHVHCAEALGVPLQMSFSASSSTFYLIPQLTSHTAMPWYDLHLVYSSSISHGCRSPTTSFPHPLVNINKSNAEEGLTNYLTYPLAEIMTWQGYVQVGAYHCCSD